MDIARGFAVLGMIYMHLVPAEGAKPHTSTEFWTRLANLLEGKSAALFCILAGMAWAIQARRAEGSSRFPVYVARRSLTLALGGIVLHTQVWTTEVLLPLACMMPLTLLVRRRGPKAVRLTMLLLVILAPILMAKFGDVAADDWLEDGGHMADHTLGWVSVRYLLFDGNYPLIPWLFFPLLGTLLAEKDWTDIRRAGRWFLAGAVVTLLSQLGVRWVGQHAASLGDYAPYLNNTWVPTSLPFLLVTGGFAVTLITGLLWWQAARPLPKLLSLFSSLGRASLTHYLMHIGAIVVPLRRDYPAEEWPVQVGLNAFLLYAALALPLSVLWFRRLSRGPFEALWARLSGPSSEP